MATAAATQVSSSLRDSLQVKAPAEAVTWLNFMIYGEAGVGKTFLCGTAEDHKDTNPVLFLDVDGGVTTLRKRKGIDVKPVRSIPELNDVYEKLFNSIDAKTQKLDYYRTIVIDRLDELADIDMRFIMREAYNRNPDRVDIDVPGPREWGINRSHIRKLVRAFRDLPAHVIFVAGVGSQADEAQPIKYFPSFAGKLRAELPGFVDIVGYYYNDNTTGTLHRHLQFQGTKRVVAKDRTSSLGEKLIDPTIPMIWDLINA